jgi:cell division protein FtsN
MERQKIFWVVLSVSVFVVIVLVVGVYLLRQKPLAASAPVGAINPITGPGPQVFEYSPQKPEDQSNQGAEQKPGEPQTLHFYIGEGAEKPQTSVPQASGGQPQEPGSQTQSPATSQTSQAPAVQQSPTPSHPGTVAAVSRRPEVAARPAVKPRQPSHRIVDYWIQTGAYKSQSKAEELVATLADKGLTGNVFSYDAKGVTYYRVRIGPYSNHREADKFLSFVKQIQGLESSYISQVGGLRNLN